MHRCTSRIHPLPRSKQLVCCQHRQNRIAEPAHPKFAAPCWPRQPAIKVLPREGSATPAAARTAAHTAPHSRPPSPPPAAATVPAGRQLPSSASVVVLQGCNGGMQFERAQYDRKFQLRFNRGCLRADLLYALCLAAFGLSGGCDCMLRRSVAVWHTTYIMCTHWLPCLLPACPCLDFACSRLPAAPLARHTCHGAGCRRTACLCASAAAPHCLLARPLPAPPPAPGGDPQGAGRLPGNPPARAVCKQQGRRSWRRRSRRSSLGAAPAHRRCPAHPTGLARTG
jgi:hypothetical protein